VGLDPDYKIESKPCKKKDHFHIQQKINGGNGGHNLRTTFFPEKLNRIFQGTKSFANASIN
jgi:hypothetical protein